MEPEPSSYEPEVDDESSVFVLEMKQSHRKILQRHRRFRQTISGILLLDSGEVNQQFSREELIKRKSQIRTQVVQHIETIQSIMLPALSKPDRHSSTSTNVLATVQNRLTQLLDAANSHFNQLLDRTSNQKERRETARKVLLDIFRLDSLLKIYLEIVELHYVPLGDRQLDEDEKKDILDSLNSIS